jgi:hypothetical protein
VGALRRAGLQAKAKAQTLVIPLHGGSR